jgi:hypothetical protein
MENHQRPLILLQVGAGWRPSQNDLLSGPDVPPSVRLRSSLAIPEADDAMKIGEIGPMSAEVVEAELENKRFLASLGG